MVLDSEVGRVLSVTQTERLKVQNHVDGWGATSIQGVVRPANEKLAHKLLKTVNISIQDSSVGAHFRD